MTNEQFEKAQLRTLDYLKKAGIAVTQEERENITVFDFDFDDLDNVGLELLVYVNTQRVCAKELILFPHQSCVEHCHPTIGDIPGKEETFRCVWGELYVMMPGEPTANLHASPPAHRREPR